MYHKVACSSLYVPANSYPGPAHTTKRGGKGLLVGSFMLSVKSSTWKFSGFCLEGCSWSSGSSWHWYYFKCEIFITAMNIIIKVISSYYHLFLFEVYPLDRNWWKGGRKWVGLACETSCTSPRGQVWLVYCLNLVSPQECIREDLFSIMHSGGI